MIFTGETATFKSFDNYVSSKLKERRESNSRFIHISCRTHDIKHEIKVCVILNPISFFHSSVELHILQDSLLFPTREESLAKRREFSFQYYKFYIQCVRNW